jgi:hypothetical protein
LQGFIELLEEYLVKDLMRSFLSCHIKYLWLII